MDDHASYVYHVHKPNDEIRLVINKSETRGYKKKGRKTKQNKQNKYGNETDNQKRPQREVLEHQSGTQQYQNK